MPKTSAFATSAGLVEVLSIPGALPPVLFFPGGHCSAKCDCGWSVYRDMGHAIVSFSRPGYGGTRVDSLSPAEFARPVREVCEQLGITAVAAAVGVSFGGMQAVHAANDVQLDVPRLILHSCAPSRLPYPDNRSERIGGPIVFSPLVQGLVWRIVRRMVRTDAGLRLLMARLSTLPVGGGGPDLQQRIVPRLVPCSNPWVRMPDSSTTSARDDPAGLKGDSTPFPRFAARLWSPARAMTVESDSHTPRTWQMSSLERSSWSWTH